VTARRIVFWRHGRTTWNAERRFQGQTDIPLDATGLAQAARAAKALARLQPHRIVSSDLVRARATAEALSELTGLPVAEDPGLREAFAGAWQGLTRSELEERFGDDLMQWSAGSDVRPGGGETRLEVAERVVGSVARGMVLLDARSDPRCRQPWRWGTRAASGPCWDFRRSTGRPLVSWRTARGRCSRRTPAGTARTGACRSTTPGPCR